MILHIKLNRFSNNSRSHNLFRLSTNHSQILSTDQRHITLSNYIMTSVESILTRQLDLRFIDARMITAEAKLSLGIDGYPSQHQIRDLQDEAVRIFYTKSKEERATMKQLNFQLESIKTPTGSVCDDDSMCVSSNHSNRLRLGRFFRKD